MENKKPRKKVSEMTREEKLSLIAFKNVMERKAKVKAETKTEQTYLTEAHREKLGSSDKNFQKYQSFERELGRKNQKRSRRKQVRRR